MKLTKRLNEIVSLIDEGTNIINIDYDHALLDIYLITEIPEVLMKYQDRIKLMVLDKLNITADSIWK